MYGRQAIEDFIFKTGTAHEGNANGSGRVIMVQDFKSLNLELYGDVDADMVVKFVKSDQEALPDFDAAQSFSNSWEYVEAVNLNTGNTVDGSTGFTLTGNDILALELNINGARWIGAIISAYADGEVQIRSKSFNNQ